MLTGRPLSPGNPGSPASPGSPYNIIDERQQLENAIHVFYLSNKTSHSHLDQIQLFHQMASMYFTGKSSPVLFFEF